MLDEPGGVMESADDGGVGAVVAFGMCGPVLVEEFDDEERRRGPSEKDEAGRRMPEKNARGWRFWRRR